MVTTTVAREVTAGHCHVPILRVHRLNNRGRREVLVDVVPERNAHSFGAECESVVVLCCEVGDEVSLHLVEEFRGHDEFEHRDIKSGQQKVARQDRYQDVRVNDNHPHRCHSAPNRSASKRSWFEVVQSHVLRVAHHVLEYRLAASGLLVAVKPPEHSTSSCEQGDEIASCFGPDRGGGVVLSVAGKSSSGDHVEGVLRPCSPGLLGSRRDAS